MCHLQKMIKEICLSVRPPIAEWDWMKEHIPECQEWYKFLRRL